MWPTVLSPEWCSGAVVLCVVCCTSQWPAKSSAHASMASIMMLLIKVSATVTVYRGHHRTLFSCPALSPCLSSIRIIWNNCLVEGRLRFEPWLLRTSRCTAHGAWVLWPLGYMGRSNSDWHWLHEILMFFSEHLATKSKSKRSLFVFYIAYFALLTCIVWFLLRCF